MDVSDEDKTAEENRNEESMNYYPSSNLVSDWQINSVNIANSHFGSISADSKMASCRGDIVGASSSATMSMVHSFDPAPWDQSSGLRKMGDCKIIQNTVTTRNALGISQGEPNTLRNAVDRTQDMGWTPPYPMFDGGIFLQNMQGMLPQSFSQFPADPAFGQHAARFPCFNAGSFNDVVNHYAPYQLMGPYSRGGAVIQGPQDISSGGELRLVPPGQDAKNVVNAAETSNVFPSSIDCMASEGNPVINDGKHKSITKCNDEAKQGLGGSGKESEEVESCGGEGVDGDQENQFMLEEDGEDMSAKCHSSKKRKRNVQAKGSQLTGEAAIDNSEIPQSADQNQISATNKTCGKQDSNASDPPKQEYIHVRARRGQATNSHSLAERLRREKISERMKLLQDLVPGCSKVTGKAVMLDEIINYVQSLQRQVEFLSMKLATVNLSLDQSVEALLAKDMQPRPHSSSSLAFAPEISVAYPQSYPLQLGVIHPAFPSTESHSDVQCGTFNSHLPSTIGLKEASQVPNTLVDDLNNVIQSYGPTATQGSHDANAPPAEEHMKVEL